MSLRFAILKQVGNEESELVLEYDAIQILTRLQARVAENLSEGTKISKVPKFKHRRTEIHKAVETAFFGLVDEFKEETIKLK